MKGKDLINKIVRVDMPDIEQVRENCHNQAMRQSTSVEYSHYPVRRRGLVVVAAVVMLLVVSTTALAALGGFEGFIQRVNPRFGEVADPIMVYSEDEGVRITLLGAQKFEYMVILYLSVSDMTEENRLTDMHFVIADINIEDIAAMAPSGSAGLAKSLNRLYFDESSNTLYQEIIITAGEAFIDPLRFSINAIYPGYDIRALEDKVIHGYWPFSVYSGDNAHQIVVITEAIRLDDYHIIELLTLTPIGLQAMGSMSNPATLDSENYFVQIEIFRSDIGVYVDTADGLRPISNNFGEGGSDGNRFDIKWQADTPIDVLAVTAIIIGDIRIPVSY